MCKIKWNDKTIDNITNGIFNNKAIDLGDIKKYIKNPNMVLIIKDIPKTI